MAKPSPSAAASSTSHSRTSTFGKPSSCSRPAARRSAGATRVCASRPPMPFEKRLAGLPVSSTSTRRRARPSARAALSPAGPPPTITVSSAGARECEARRGPAAVWRERGGVWEQGSTARWMLLEARLSGCDVRHVTRLQPGDPVLLRCGGGGVGAQRAGGVGRGEVAKEAIEAAGHGHDQQPSLARNDAPLSVRHPARREHGAPGGDAVLLVPNLEYVLALEHVEQLVLVGVQVARRVDHRRQLLEQAQRT